MSRGAVLSTGDRDTRRVRTNGIRINAGWWENLQSEANGVRAPHYDAGVYDNPSLNSPTGRFDQHRRIPSAHFLGFTHIGSNAAKRAKYRATGCISAALLAACRYLRPNVPEMEPRNCGDTPILRRALFTRSCDL